MDARYPSPRRIKVHRNYSIEEIARILKVHKNTVRRWTKNGLSAINDKSRPRLYLGPELKRFLGERQVQTRRPCPPGHMYCFRCREPKSPVHGEADLLPLTAEMASLCGMCQCGTLMYRRVSRRTLHRATSTLTVTVPKAPLRIGGLPSPIVNGDLIEEWKAYAKTQCGERADQAQVLHLA
jgi:Helix-turn-helix domain